jgi:hypothetical protein
VSNPDPVFAKRWQQLLKSDAPGWMKRGAYRYLLRHLPINTTDLHGTQKLLVSVGIHTNFAAVSDFCAEVEVGIEHIDEIIVRRLMADAWMEEDETWYVGEKPTA